MPASVVLKCYDWAIEQGEKGNCIISGFHSQIEKDVLHYLLKGRQPIIIALARGLKEKLEPELHKSFDNKHLLIVTPFEKQIKRVTEQTATVRNKMMIEIADEIVTGYVNPKGNLKVLIDEANKAIVNL